MFFVFLSGQYFLWTMHFNVRHWPSKLNKGIPAHEIRTDETLDPAMISVMSISWFCSHGQWGMWGWLPLCSLQPTEVVLNTVDLFCCRSGRVWRQPSGCVLIPTTLSALSALRLRGRNWEWTHESLCERQQTLQSVLMKQKNTRLFLADVKLIRYFFFHKVVQLF